MNVKVIGHRGLRQHAEIDENSAKAVEVAFATADGAEIDGAQSRDGTVFLSHETMQKYSKHLFSRSRYVFSEHLDAASAAAVGKRRIEQLTAAELKGLTLKKGGKVGQLSEVFRLAAQYPGKMINIEVKGEHAVEPIIREINQAVASGQITKEQVILTSFNHPAILKARELAPEIRRGLIFSGSSRFDWRIFPWSGNWKSRYIVFNEKALKSKRTQKIAPEFFVLKAAAVTPENIELLRKHFPAGKVMFWTTNEPLPEQNDHVIKVLTDPRIAPAIEAVISDHPEQMVKLLKAKGLHA
jgi:glycerophosphoryl diester phosphodiesterase